MRQKITKLDQFTKSVAQTAFPSYRGRKFYLQAQESIDVRSYWDGGSRDYFTFVRLADMQTLAMPPQSAYDRQLVGADKAPIPPGFVCVEHSIFCGKDSGITFHVNPADMPRMLPVSLQGEESRPCRPGFLPIREDAPASPVSPERED